MQCSKTREIDPPETPSDVLNEFVRSAPIQYINLDVLETRYIDLGDDDIIYNVNSEVQEGDTFLGLIRTFTRFHGQFYVYDSPGKAIYRVDNEGAVEGPLTREGKGPGEHLTVGNLRSNNRFLYAIDANNARINRYTPEMTAAAPLMEYISLSILFSVSLNDDRILTENTNSMGFAPEKPDEGLIAISSIHDLTDTLATVLPRIIPPGYQPNVFNTPRFSINGQNKLAASYSPLPWFFLFDEYFNHTQTLILGYSVFEKMDLPAMDYFRPSGNEGFGGAIPVTQYRLLDNGELLVIIGDELIRISLIEHGEYQAIGKYRFIHSGEEEPMWLMDIVPSESKNEFYGGNWEYLFRFALSD